MTGRDALFCLLAVATAASASGSQSPRVRSDQEVLIQLEQDWDKAFHGRDVGFIENILADEFMVTYPDGSRGDRTKELALAAAFNQPIESSALDEFTVKVYGDTAVVWFTQHLIVLSQGRALAVTSRYVDVFVIRAGRWQCVASQSTRAAAA
ncbi:MAG: nuclear transport factor 2 family protein [Acidobacteria bacterium]|nr:nuclear transport factor 2 family protein [Acidobacteriota bacterium]